MSEFDHYGITFNGKHTWRDFGLRVTDKSLGFPAKDKVLVTLPYSNHIVDLSNLYGQQIFGSRTLKWTFLVINQSSWPKEILYNRWTQLVNFLEQATTRVPLFDDIMPDYYYLAEVVTAPTWDEYRVYGKFTIEFAAYPFRIHDTLEGNDIWDTFNFEADIAQETKYEISKSKDIILFNIGTSSVQPTIITTSEFTLTINNDAITIPSGRINPENSAYPVTLSVGENHIHVVGDGSIEFQWHKELI